MFQRLFLTFVFWIGLAALAFAGAGQNATRLDQLFSALSKAQKDEWQVIEAEIHDLWQESGSASMDLLLKGGWAALTAQDTEAAIEHFTALVDHAPNFAEGWNARATAYFRAGLYGPSMADIRQTLALEPRHFGALAGLGFILEEAGKHEQAHAVYEEVLRLHPFQETVTEAVARIENALGALDT